MDRIREWAFAGIVAALIVVGLFGGSTALEAGDPAWPKQTAEELLDTTGYGVEGTGNIVPASTNVTTSTINIEHASKVSLELTIKDGATALGVAQFSAIPIYNQSTNLTGYALPAFPTDRITITNLNDQPGLIYTIDVEGKGKTMALLLSHTGSTSITARAQVIRTL